jgi:hypothetical protein
MSPFLAATQNPVASAAIAAGAATAGVGQNRETQPARALAPDLDDDAD